jgi:hypothetical protein
LQDGEVGASAVLWSSPTHRGTAREEVVAVVAGPAIYLLALRCFASGWRARSARRDSLERLPALGAIAPALVLIASVVGVLVAVIVYEHVAGARRSAAGERSPVIHAPPAR